MTVEDLLTYMFQMQYDFAFGEWEASFIRSVGQHTINERALSTRQGEVVIRIGKKYRETLFASSSDQKKLDILLANPVYRIDPFVSEMYPREVRYAGDNLLAFRFKMNEGVKQDIKKLSPRASRQSGGQVVFFAKAARVWVVPVTLSNVEMVQTVIAEHDFGFNDPVLALIADISSSRGVLPQAIYDDEGKQIVLAAVDNGMLGWFTEHVLGGKGH